MSVSRLALAGLISDSLVVRADNNWDLVAPTHDVLEDWAILRWLDRLYLEVNKELALFQTALGTHPALRRSYRKWMGELLERESSSGQVIFQEALSGQNLTASFRDDTLVALLQASAAGSLLLEREPELLSNNRQNLKRVIHLVRLPPERAYSANRLRPNASHYRSNILRSCTRDIRQQQHWWRNLRAIYRPYRWELCIQPDRGTAPWNRRTLDETRARQT